MTAGSEPGPGETSRPRRGRRALAIAALVIVVAGAVALAYGLARGGRAPGERTGGGRPAPRERAPGAVAPAPARPGLAEVADGLDSPTDLEVRPGEPGRLYVSEQPGRVQILERGRVLPRPFLDLGDQVRSGGEQGLLGLAFPPDHARTGLLYAHYTNRAGDTRVVRFRARGDRVDPRSAVTLLALHQPYANHNGGQLAFDRQGRLLLGLGDGGSEHDPHRIGQDLRSPLAKIRRLDVRRPGARWETVAYGLRNPWRFSFDRATGDLWIADVGQDAWEEVDVLPAGMRELPNYGWSALDARHRTGHPLNPRGRLMPPVAVYTHRDGCAVIGGYVYRGRALPGLRGRYLYGDLCTGYVWSVRRQGSRAEVRREPIELSGLTTFDEDARGELYAASQDGRVMALRPARKGR